MTDEAEDGELLPPQVPMAVAAGRPIGSAQTAINKIVDVGAVVFAPFLVPACVLAIARTGGARNLLDSFTLVDFAFGIVAVSFAALARALTGRGEGWTLVAPWAILAIVFETAIAISRDTAVKSDDLTRLAASCPEKCDVSALRDLSEQILALNPAATHWIVALLIGASLAAISVYAIWTEA